MQMNVKIITTTADDHVPRNKVKHEVVQRTLKNVIRIEEKRIQISLPFIGGAL